MKKRPVVEVVWLDAWAEHGNVALDEVDGHDGLVTHSVGYLVGRTKKGITLASSHWPSDMKEYGGVDFIPAKMVVGLRYLSSR